MSAASSYSVFVAPLAVVLRRLEAAHEPGKILHRMKLAPALSPDITRSSALWAAAAGEVISNNQLPCLRLRGIACTQETPRMGGARRVGSDGSKMDTPTTTQHQIFISVLSAIPEGFVQPNTEDPHLPPGHYDWVGKVMDAIETDSADEGDSTLEHTSTLPITMSAVPAETESDLYYETVITITVSSKPHYRGERARPVGS